MPDEPLIEGRDYTIEPDGRWVFTAAFLLRRGYCCKNGCRNCPYPSGTGIGPASKNADYSPQSRGERGED